MVGLHRLIYALYRGVSPTTSPCRIQVDLPIVNRCIVLNGSLIVQILSGEG